MSGYVELSKIKIELNEKIMENENYQQELYDLKNKLKTLLATQKDLSHANELMEESLIAQQTTSEKKINNLIEKFAIQKKNYEEKIAELQTNLTKEEKRNEELKDELNNKEKLFLKLRTEDPDKINENFTLKEKIDCLLKDLEKKDILECELLSKQRKLEENNLMLEKNYNEINDILQVKKGDLESMEDILETTREELFVCRSELESLKAVPASDSLKGNSLFAEVEDNRKKLVDDMTRLQTKYLQTKQTWDVKDQEIRTLKAEKAALLSKLEDDTIISVNQSARLIETYKSRISELENKLKIEKKKSKSISKEQQQQPVENSFSYLQSLLTAKKKEVEDLLNKLEESSIQKILQEEMKYEIEKQLRQWRWKAMSYQAKLLASENPARCNECLKMKLNESGDRDISINTEEQDSRSSETPKSSFLGSNQSETTLEKLLQIPHEPVSTSREKILTENNSTIIDLDKTEESFRSFRTEESISMEETLPVSSFPVSNQLSPPKEEIPSDDESDKENSAINVIEKEKTILKKSSLAKSEELQQQSSSKKTEEKCKKVLRFTPDTVDPQKPKLSRQKMEKKSYPVVFIPSSLPNTDQSDK